VTTATATAETGLSTPVRSSSSGESATSGGTSVQIVETYSLALGIAASGDTGDLLIGTTTLISGGPPITTALKTISLAPSGVVSVDGSLTTSSQFSLSSVSSTSMVSTVACHQVRQTGAPDFTNLLLAMTGYGNLPNPWVDWACSQFPTDIFSNGASPQNFGINTRARVLAGQGSDIYSLTMEQNGVAGRFCHPAIADLFQECVIQGNFYGGVWWNENESYNLTNLVSIP
jgi:hypothetical protein